jgi:hypothetical protein
MPRTDIYAPIHARRKAIDWRAVHVTSDSLAPFGMFPGVRIPLAERIGRFFGRGR